MKDLNSRLKDKEIEVELSDRAVAFIADEAYEPAFGARPLKRYLQKNVETLLAKKLLAGDVSMGETLTIDAVDGRLVV